MTVPEAIASISDERLRSVVEKIFKGFKKHYNNNTFNSWVTQLGSSVANIWVGPGAAALVSIASILKQFYDTFLSPGSIVVAVQEFATYVNNLYYQRFWPLIGSGYTREEICDICAVPRQGTGSERMVQYYQRAGLPQGVKNAMAQYVNGSISMAQLASAMHLDTEEHVWAVLGKGWCAAAGFNRTMLSEGVNPGMESSKAALQASVEALLAADEQTRADAVAIVEAIAESPLSLVELDRIFTQRLLGGPGAAGGYNMVQAGEADVSISGTEGNDMIAGNALNNGIAGGAGDDILVGGRGDDALDGGAGSDSYLWRLGDGNDTISDAAGEGEGNALFFGDSVDETDIAVSRDGNDVVFTHNSSDPAAQSVQAVRVSGWFSNDANRMEVNFIGGKTWTVAQIEDAIANGTLLPGQEEPGGEANPPSPTAIATPTEGVTGLRYEGAWQGSSAWEVSSVASLVGASSQSKASRMNMDIAIASLGFGREDPGQVCEIVPGASPYVDYHISSSVGQGFGERFFSPENERKSA